MKSQKSKSKQYKIPPSFQAILAKEELSLFEEYFNTASSKKLREKLAEFFERKVSTSYAKTDKENKYEIPSWSEYQADAIGYRRACKEIIKFLT